MRAKCVLLHILKPKCLPNSDIYLAQEKNLELFVQVGYDALDTGDGGISGETNPGRHREIAKKLAPAFSMRNLRAKERAVQKHIDLFVQRIKGQCRGAETTWTPPPAPAGGAGQGGGNAALDGLVGVGSLGGHDLW